MLFLEFVPLNWIIQVFQAILSVQNVQNVYHDFQKYHIVDVF